MITPILSTDKSLLKRGCSGDMVTFIKDSRTESAKLTEQDIREATALIDYLNGITGLTPTSLRVKKQQKPLARRGEGLNALRSPERFYSQLVATREKLGYDIPTRITKSANYKTARQRFNLSVFTHGVTIHWPGGHFPENIPEETAAFIAVIKRVNAEARQGKKKPSARTESLISTTNVTIKR
jgi:hypothetical protein